MRSGCRDRMEKKGTHGQLSKSAAETATTLSEGWIALPQALCELGESMIVSCVSCDEVGR